MRDYDPYPQSQIDPVFRTVASKWVGQIEHARKYKKKVFGDAADEKMEFYRGPRDWSELMAGSGFTGNTTDLPEPLFRISVNKVFEFVSIVGPALYYESPVRTVRPRMPVSIPYEFLQNLGVDPFSFESMVGMEQARVQADGLRAALIGAYLNWSPHETGLAKQSTDSINEALIKGRGCLWTERKQPPGANFHVVTSSYDTVNNLLVDPDAHSLETAFWIARRCVRPCWEVERDYKLRPGCLKANAESEAAAADASVDADTLQDRQSSKSNDLFVYYEVWSKMGIGGRLPGMKPGITDVLEMFGDYSYMVIAKDTPFLLNLPPDVVNQEMQGEEFNDQIFGATAWPTPFWADGEWPVTCLDFCKIPGRSWPMSPIHPGIGELRFLNWATSFLCGHVRNSARDFVAIWKGVDDKTKQTIHSGTDLELIEFTESSRPISDVIQWLQHPPMNKDLFEVIEIIEQNFDKRVGLTELMYGVSGVQLRSATEADVKQQNMSVRPEAMAKTVETWQAEVACKEAMAARYHLTPDDVRPVLGDLGAAVWQMYVSTRDPQVAARELEYQIESGSTRKPNKNWEVQQMNQAVQTIGPIFQAYMQQTGDPTAMNNLLSDYAKANDLDPDRYQLAAALPPVPSQQPAGGPEAVQTQPTGNSVPAQG